MKWSFRKCGMAKTKVFNGGAYQTYIEQIEVPI